MSRDVNLTEKLLRLCVLHQKKCNISDEKLSVCIAFSTKKSVNYVLFGLPYSENQSVIIARNNNNDDVVYPNGVLYMDGFWFVSDLVEQEQIIQELDSQFEELNYSFLSDKLEGLVEADLLPKGLRLL